ncbi:hypothetical protein [Roseiconus lacunae]|uniref:Secreted protein n=1 Tax=Roseiconus lacunae TaxID=2605694 RepID=A0ABT7PEV1_9BACT|nr:hypothetical protein [Roseiconus lacunae]MDM4014888.1 hypothetical protein [Roseiconus lacunae]
MLFIFAYIVEAGGCFGTLLASQACKRGNFASQTYTLSEDCQRDMLPCNKGINGRHCSAAVSEGE